MFPLPQLTEERRKDLSKQVAKMGEESKVVLRNVRRDTQKSADGLKKDGALSEDEHKRLVDELQKVMAQPVPPFFPAPGAGLDPGSRAPKTGFAGSVVFFFLGLHLRLAAPLPADPGWAHQVCR